MGLFDLFKKKKKLKKSKASKEDIKKGVEALRKISKAKNDKEFIEGMMNLPINKNKRPLVFKGGREAFEYIQKFIDTNPLKAGNVYYGVLGAGAKFAQIHCKVKGKTETMMARIDGKECDTQIDMDDLVLIKVQDVRKGLTLKESLDISKLKDKSQKSVLSAIVKITTQSSIGIVVKKLKPEMSVKTMTFDRIDE